MKVVAFKGYVVKFCGETRCGHKDRDFCVNPKTSKFYISEKTAEKLSRNIVAGTPVVLSHDSECQVGEIRDSWVTDFGIIVRGYVNDARLLAALRSQVEKYRKQYSRKMSYEDYVQNLFSSISLSHDPNTLHVNHIGLVNIPGRTGTEIKYELTQTVPVKRYSCSDNDIRDSISAHLVAFLRNPNRVDKLVWNGRNSYANKTPHYLQASEKPYSVEEMPSNSRDSMVIDLASQLLELAGGGGRKRYREDPSDDQIQPKRRKEVEPSAATEEKLVLPNEDALVEKISKKFETQIASMSEKYDKRILELEESRTKELSSLTDFLKSAAAPSPPVSVEHQPATTSEPIEAAAGTTRVEIDRYKSRKDDLQALLLNTLRSSLLERT